MTMRYLLLISLAACTGDITDNPGDDMPEPVTCDQARTYAGFGGPLEADRPAIAGGSDRMRLKPFAALSAEYSRALALTAFDTAPFAATFGRPPARWYAEPEASANTVYAAFSLAYAGCTEHTKTNAMFAGTPDPAAADRLCKDFARAAWQREATQEEADACATYAVEKTNPADAPPKRWAYACAAVLTASSFLAY
jgi:hypothetical protein